MSYENITRRNPKAKTLTRQNTSNTSSLSEDSDAEINKALSLPDLSTIPRHDIEDYIEQINTLKIQLESANNQIDELLLENSSLIKELEKKQALINKMNIILTGSTQNKKSKKKKMSDKKHLSKRKLNFQCDTPCSKAEDEYSVSRSLRTDSKQTNILHATPEKKEFNISTKNIYIIGGQQCVGLASQLTTSRRDTKYEQYNISAITKPYALTKDILKSCYSLRAKRNDYVIISVGENDYNPTRLQIELSAALKYFENCNVILLGISANSYLNETKLNNYFKKICSNLSNCKLINCYNNNLKNSIFIENLCYKINLYIDSCDYETKYLPMFKNKHFSRWTAGKSVSRVLQNTQNANSFVENSAFQLKPKKGTIPFYFPVLYKNNKNIEDSQNGQFITQPDIHKYKKGTIPFYFPIKTQKYQEFVALQSAMQIKNKFFRK